MWRINKATNGNEHDIERKYFWQQIIHFAKYEELIDKSVPKLCSQDTFEMKQKIDENILNPRTLNVNKTWKMPIVIIHLSRCQGNKVLDCLGNIFAKQTDLNASNSFIPNGHVEENLKILNQ